MSDDFSLIAELRSLVTEASEFSRVFRDRDFSIPDIEELRKQDGLYDLSKRVLTSYHRVNYLLSGCYRYKLACQEFLTTASRSTYGYQVQGSMKDAVRSYLDSLKDVERMLLPLKDDLEALNKFCNSTSYTLFSARTAAI